MKLVNYTPILNWRGLANKSGRYSVHIRITIAGKSRYHKVPLPLKVAREEWSKKVDKWVKDTHPYALEINNVIAEKLQKLREFNKRCYTAKIPPSFSLVEKELRSDYNANIFNSYYEEVINNPPESLKAPTIRRYRSALNALNSYNSNIPFYELSEGLFLNIQRHLLETMKLKRSSARGYFNAFKKIVYWSRLEGHVSKVQQESCFERIDLRVGKPKPQHLEPGEIAEWMGAECAGKYASYERDRDMFTLQICTGFYYNDLREMKKSDLLKDAECGYYIRGDRFKNDNLAIVPLWKFPQALELLEKYKSQDANDEYLFRRDCFVSSATFNNHIKFIARELLDWSRNITNKLGRSTNAQLYVRAGANRTILSKMLGHGEEKNAEYYYKVSIKDIAEAVKEMNFENIGMMEVKTAA